MNLESILSTIDEYGLMVRGVTVSAGQSFAYTVGLAKYGLADAILFCSDLRMAHRTLNLYFTHVRQYGQFYGRSNDLIEGRNGEIMPVHVSPLVVNPTLLDEYFTSTIFAYYAMPDLVKIDKLEFVQLMIPDKNARLPYDVGYDHEAQPQQVINGGFTKSCVEH